MKILYYDCFSGISGDMNLGALIDLGVDKDALLQELKCLKLECEYDIQIRKESRRGISGTRVEIKLSVDEQSAIHARGLRDITNLLQYSTLSPPVKKRSIKMFEMLAEAEAKVHGTSIDKVHFHEVGGTDAIVDIVGAAFCLEQLQVDSVLSSTVELGGGFVNCQHGRLPVPAPAVTELLQHFPVRKGTVDFETTTPTGAVILAANVQAYTDKLDFSISRVGYGVGQRDLEIPNVLRVYLGETVALHNDWKEDGSVVSKTQYMIETNIDDMNPEHYEYLEEQLFAAGALDTYKTPIIMKKGRPAVTLSVLVKEADISVIEKIIFQETTAIGLRLYPVIKKMLPRKLIQVGTVYGTVSLKYAYYDGLIKIKPEYEECKKLALEHGVPLKEVYNQVMKSLDE